MAPFLLQMASQGIVVLANGPPQKNGTGDYASFGTYGRSSWKYLQSSIDWVEQNAGKGKWAHLDPTRIAAAGQSCGGGEAYGVANDPRVKVIGIFNSGGMTGMGGTNASPATFTKPVWFLYIEYGLCANADSTSRSFISSAVQLTWHTVM
jgi:hypothetical protein